MELDKIYCTDCLKAMREIPSGSVQLVVADPPYELKQHGESKGSAFGRKGREYHSTIEPMQTGVSFAVLEEMVRVCEKPNIYLFCSKDQLYKILPWAVSHNLKYDILTWHKTNPVPTCNNKYLSDTEYIVFMRNGADLYGSYDTKHKYFLTPTNTKDKKMYGHPTPKPVNILQTLIENSTREGAVVLDPYMGCGSTAIACLRSGRHFIGFDIDENYCKMAEQRIQNFRDSEW